MSANQTYSQAWRAYESAVKDLFAPPPGAADETERDVAKLATEELAVRADRVLAGAERVRESLGESLRSGDPGQREFARLKLIASAAYDLSTANDLLDFERTGSSPQAARSLGMATVASEELGSILDTPLEAGMAGLLPFERVALPDDPVAARQQLEDMVGDFVTVIPQDASDMSQMAISGVVNLGFGPAQGLFSLTLQELISRIPDTLSPIVRRAAELALEAIRKLQTAIGAESVSQAEEQAAKWVAEIQGNRDLVTSLLDKLYETPRITNETMEMVQSAPESTPSESFNKATQTLRELLDYYGKTTGALDGLMRIVSLIKGVFLASLPWGPPALYLTYLSILIYAVYSGGDYMDWYRTGNRTWLDRVQGLRSTVRNSLGVS